MKTAEVLSRIQTSIRQRTQAAATAVLRKERAARAAAAEAQARAETRLEQAEAELATAQREAAAEALGALDELLARMGFVVGPREARNYKPLEAAVGEDEARARGRAMPTRQALAMLLRATR